MTYLSRRDFAVRIINPAATTLKSKMVEGSGTGVIEKLVDLEFVLPSPSVTRICIGNVPSPKLPSDAAGTVNVGEDELYS